MQNCIDFQSCIRKIYLSLYYKNHATVAIAESTGKRLISGSSVRCVTNGFEYLKKP